MDKMVPLFYTKDKPKPTRDGLTHEEYISELIRYDIECDVWDLYTCDADVGGGSGD